MIEAHINNAFEEVSRQTSAEPDNGGLELFVGKLGKCINPRCAICSQVDKDPWLMFWKLPDEDLYLSAGFLKDENYQKKDWIKTFGKSFSKADSVEFTQKLIILKGVSLQDIEQDPLEAYKYGRRTVEEASTDDDIMKLIVSFSKDQLREMREKVDKWDITSLLEIMVNSQLKNLGMDIEPLAMIDINALQKGDPEEVKKFKTLKADLEGLTKGEMPQASEEVKEQYKKKGIDLL